MKAVIYKAHLHIADMDRHLYADHQITLARHPDESDEHLMVRLLIFALNVPVYHEQGVLEMGRSLWDKDEPDLWQKDFTGHIVHWIDVGQPDLKRMTKMVARCDKVSVYDPSESTLHWWGSIQNKLIRVCNLSIWHVPPEASAALACMLNRTMQLRFTVQESDIWVGDEKTSVDLQLKLVRGFL